MGDEFDDLFLLIDGGYLDDNDDLNAELDGIVSEVVEDEPDADENVSGAVPGEEESSVS